VLIESSGGLSNPPAGSYLGSNGMAADKDGTVLLCQHAARRIVRVAKDMKLEPVVERFEDKRLNSPNDLVLRADGSIYFTDPPDESLRGFSMDTILCGRKESQQHPGDRKAHEGCDSPRLELTSRHWSPPQYDGPSNEVVYALPRMEYGTDIETDASERPHARQHREIDEHQSRRVEYPESKRPNE